VTVTNSNGCTAQSAPVTVTVNPKPTPTITVNGPTNFCPGTSRTLNAGSGYTSYLWSNGSTLQAITTFLPGTYTVTVTNAFGCTGTASRTLNLASVPPLTITATNNGVQCSAGQTITLTASSGFFSYSWSNNAITASTYVTSPGTYSVTATSLTGCIRTASATVTLATACQTPTGHTVLNLTPTTAVLAWLPVPCAYQYRVSRRPVGGNWGPHLTTPGAGISLTGLIPNTTYEWRVVARCGSLAFSNASAIFTFTTPALSAKKEEPSSAEAGLPAPLLYPNPNNGYFTLDYFAEAEVELQICVFDMYGKQVHCGHRLASEGDNQWEMEFPDLAKGIYFLKVQGVGQGSVDTQTMRFMVE
jgi:Secretion system C-terminal sorting domain/Fibronectin type III domain